MHSVDKKGANTRADQMYYYFGKAVNRALDENIPSTSSKTLELGVLIKMYTGNPASAGVNSTSGDASTPTCTDRGRLDIRTVNFRKSRMVRCLVR